MSVVDDVESSAASYDLPIPKLVISVEAGELASLSQPEQVPTYQLSASQLF